MGVLSILAQGIMGFVALGLIVSGLGLLLVLRNPLGVVVLGLLYPLWKVNQKLIDIEYEADMARRRDAQTTEDRAMTDEEDTKLTDEYLAKLEPRIIAELRSRGSQAPPGSKQYREVGLELIEAEMRKTRQVMGEANELADRFGHLGALAEKERSDAARQARVDKLNNEYQSNR